ncbi:hypothetical protein [Sedimenticola selenatireducens]|uniref:hypothetical protein n=1 Tax=Sedimenticola selenatireducens TaxID=191960 RepID=UPI002AAAF032|nr:hypothetical protein [Sedimenticola selenatireducens]
MAEETDKIECIHCGAGLPDGHTSPCPECGQKGRRISIGIAEEIDVAGHITWERRREFYEKKPLVLATAIAITIGAPFLGLFLIGWPGVIAGLVLGGAAFWIGPVAVIKVREIERGG